MVERPVTPPAEELLPCPFCGGTANMDHINAFWSARCRECCSATAAFSSGDGARTAWNRRAYLPELTSLRAERERLRVALAKYGRHSSICHSGNDWPCNCGWETARTALDDGTGPIPIYSGTLKE